MVEVTSSLSSLPPLYFLNACRFSDCIVRYSGSSDAGQQKKKKCDYKQIPQFFLFTFTLTMFDFLK